MIRESVLSTADIGPTVEWQHPLEEQGGPNA